MSADPKTSETKDGPLRSVNEYSFGGELKPKGKPEVIQAMSTTAGGFYAIKFFPHEIIAPLSQSEVSRSIAVVKKMDHRNVIKCHEVINKMMEGQGIFVVMDWCEGNSLRQTIEQFRHIPEALVARYIMHVLEGLEYLHSKDTSHNNLKASNILLTNGVVQLTDFGLSAQISNLHIEDHPWWSAPEVLESRQFSPKSDIWSLGCTIVELITGSPPFRDLAPKDAREKILAESCLPPLPTNASMHLRDFLGACFVRDPKERVDAKRLKGYFWITTNQREHVQRPLNQPKKVSTIAIAASNGGHTNPNWDDLDNLFSDEEVPNEEGLPQVVPTEPKPAVTIPGLSEPTDDDSSDFSDLPKGNPTARLSFATGPKSPTLPAPPKPAIALPIISSKKATDSDSDSDAFSTRSTSTSTSRSAPSGKEKTAPQASAAPPMPLQLPNKAPGQAPIHLPNTNENDFLDFEDEEEDRNSENYHMMVAEKEKEKKAGNGQAETPNQAKNDAPSLKKGGDDSTTTEFSTGPFSFGNVKGPATLPGGQTTLHGKVEEAARPATLNRGAEIREDLKQWAEPEGEMDLVETPADKGGLEFPTFAASKPAGDLEWPSSDNEPEIFERTQKLGTKKTELISKITALTSKDETSVMPTLKEILKILEDEPEVRVGLSLHQEAVLPLIEILQNTKFEELPNEELATLFLTIIAKMCDGMEDIKENFCLLGGIPPVMQFFATQQGSQQAPRYSAKLREAAHQILTDMCQRSPDNLQMFLACNGVSSLVTILGYDVKTEWAMMATSVQIMYNIFAPWRARQKADFCRLFTKAGVLQPMSNILFYFATKTERDTRDKTIQEMLTNICKLWKTFSQADLMVKKEMSMPDVMKNITATMFDEKTGVKMTLTMKNIRNLCKGIKFIAMESETRDNLQASHTVDMACELIKYRLPAPELQEDAKEWKKIWVYLIMFLNDMCKLTKMKGAELRESSSSSVVVIARRRILVDLRKFLKEESELKAMSLGVIMELYNVNGTDKESMKTLIDDGLIDVYIDYLTKSYWCTKASKALLPLFLDDKLHIEEILTRPESLEKVRQAVEQVNEHDAPTLLEELKKICDRSPTFVEKLVNEKFGKILIGKFSMKIGVVSQVPVTLLDLVWSIFKFGRSCVKYLKTPELKKILHGYERSENRRQGFLSTEILKYFK